MAESGRQNKTAKKVFEKRPQIRHSDLEYLDGYGVLRMMNTIHDSRYIAMIRHLKRVRKAGGITQKQLAAKLGFSQSSVAKVEGLERRLDVIELIDWLHALGYDLEHFLYEVSILNDGDDTDSTDIVGRWIWHIRNDVIFAANDVYRLFGFDPESMLGSSLDFQRFLCTIDKRDRKRVCTDIEEILSRQSCKSVSFKVTRADGTKRTILVQGTMQVDEKGKPYRARGEVRDVTNARMSRRAGNRINKDAAV